jgi:hypothetical protein
LALETKSARQRANAPGPALGTEVQVQSKPTQDASNREERNQASTASLLESLYEGERVAHEKTKRRVAIAEARLAQGMERLTALFDYNPTYWDEP